jgi:dienelactone hydrolase
MLDQMPTEIGREKLPGILTVPKGAAGLVIFVHGSGSSRLSARNRQVANGLNKAGMATLLFDLLHPEEEGRRDLVFDIPFLADRLEDAVRWAQSQFSPDFPIGLFGASTGAAAALLVAGRLGRGIGAVVSRGGRPDLAGAALEQVSAPTLLIVGGADFPVIDLNRLAQRRLIGIVDLEIVPSATHLFPEPGAMEQVTELAAGWFERYLTENPE